MTRFGQVAAWALVLSVSSLAGAQSASERAAARSAANSGREAFDAGNFSGAVDYFTRAEALLHAPSHLLYLARAQAKLGHLVDAHENYSRILHENLAPNAPDAFKRARADAETEAAALEPRLASVTVMVRGASASALHVMMDDKEIPAAMVGIALPADAGSHVFKATADHAYSPPVTVSLKEGGKESVVLTLTPRAGSAAEAPVVSTAAAGTPAPAEPSATPPAAEEHSGSGMRIAAYVAFGVGALGLGAGTYFTLKASGTRKDGDNAYAACLAALASNTCNAALAPERAHHVDSLDSDYKSQRAVGVAGFVTGGVGVAAGVTFLMLASHSSTKSESAVRVVPVVGLGSLGVAGAF